MADRGGKKPLRVQRVVKGINMRFVIVLVLIIAGVACLGLCRGWFSFTSDRSADKSNVTLTVDKDKVQDDKQKAVGKVRDLGHQAK
jgi:hypothetical protein